MEHIERLKQNKDEILETIDELYALYNIPENYDSKIENILIERLFILTGRITINLDELEMDLEEL